MKLKHLFIIAVLAAIPLTAWAWGVVSISGGVAAVGECTAQDTFAAAYNAYDGVYYTTPYYAFKFTAGSSYSVTKISLWFSTDGTPTGTISADLYSDGGTAPGTKLADATSTVNAASFTGTLTEFSFLFDSVSLTSSTPYYVVLTVNGLTDNIRVAVQTTESLTNGDMSSTDGSSWKQLNNMQAAIKTYSGTCE